VTIISAGASQRLFPSTDPIGRTVHAGGKVPHDLRVIGVAADIVTCCIPYGKDAALMYLPISPREGGSLLVGVRGEVEAEKERLDSMLNARVQGAVEDIHSLNQYRAAGSYPFQVASWIGLAVAGIALVLTVSGIYGVLAYAVTQRTREIGIRVAMGATSGEVLRMVLKQSLRLAVIGIGLGLPIGLALCRLMASEIVFLREFDLPISVASVVLVASAALAAAYMPARRAARIQAADTLRSD
jgi:hypothetical protein